MIHSVGTKEVTPSLVISCIKLPLAGLLVVSVVHSNSFLKYIQYYVHAIAGQHLRFLTKHHLPKCINCQFPCMQYWTI